MTMDIYCILGHLHVEVKPLPSSTRGVQRHRPERGSTEPPGAAHHERGQGRPRFRLVEVDLAWEPGGVFVGDFNGFHMRVRKSLGTYL